MEELSKQLSAELNEFICVTGTSDYCWREVVDNKNNIKLVNHNNTQKLEPTKIIEKYNELREYRNSINKEYNFVYSIEGCISNNNITIKYDANIIQAGSYIVLTERVKKIEELKNQILSFGKEFNFSCINFNDHITIKINNIVDKVMINIYNNTTKFIEIYNEVREYRNSINKEYNLDCSIEKDSSKNNITIKYDANIISAVNYIELTEKVKKIEELNNQILSVDKDFNFIWNDYDEIYYFDNQINNISINIDTDCTWNDYDIDIDLIIESYNEIIAHKIDKDYKFIIEHNNDNICFKIEKINIIDNTTYTISIETIKLSSIFEMYSQFREYINNNENFDCNIFKNDELNKIYISSYTDIDKNDKFNISISNSDNITSIIKIFIEVKNYIKSIEENNKKQLILNFNAEYDESIVKNINLELYDCLSKEKTKIEVNNYIELSEIIQLKEEEKRLKEEEKRLKEEEEKRLKEQEKQEKQEKLAIKLSKFLKEDVIVEDIDNESFVISGEGINKKFKIKILYWNYGTKPLSPNIPDIPCDIFPNIPNINIHHIYNQVKNYKNINLKPEVIYYIDTLYTQTNSCFFTTNITIKYDDCIFTGNNYIECDKKILEHVKMNELKLKEQETIKLKEEQEKVSTKLKLKYGDKTDWTITYKKYIINNFQNLQLDLVITDVDIEYINLLDIIPNYQTNIIISGYIKNTNYVDYQDIGNKSIYKCDLAFPKHILNITIQNCPNLKIINNIIHFENNCNLKIVNCPKIEFIQNYNNFTEIYMNNCLVKVVNE